MITWNQIGDWNPQLTREVKGRLTSSSFWIAIGGAILAQAVLLLVCQQMLPDATGVGFSNRYCMGPSAYYAQFQCEQDAAGYLLVNWSLWWQDIFRVITWALPLTWIVGSVYVLIGDLIKEKRRGTLNFIQLSPRSRTTIFLGKLLGVPFCLHLFLALFLPLHLISGVLGGISWVNLVCFYSVTLGIWGVLASGSVLSAILGGVQAWLGTVIAAAGTFPLFWMISYGLWGGPQSYWGEELRSSLSEVAWFDLPIGAHVELGSLFILINCGVAMGWIWWTLLRRFGSVDRTVLSKRSSYLLTSCLHLVGVGFVWPGLSISQISLEEEALLLSLLQIPFGLGLIWSLAPHRQAVLDWVFYRRAQASSKSLTLVRDLIWGENSPMLVALALNLGIMVVLWLPLIWMTPISVSERLNASLALFSILPLWMIYGVIVQLLVLPKGYRLWWSGVGVLVALCFPFITGAIWHDVVGRPLGIWVFFIYAGGGANVDRFAFGDTLVGLSLPWLVLGLLLWFFSNRIHQLGRSEAQQILTPIPAGDQ